MDAQTGGSHPPFEGVESHAPQPFSPPGPALEGGEASTDRRQRIGQTQVPQDLHSIGPQGQACPDLAQLRIALEDHDLDTLAL
jgi:hypothetical protein